MSSVLLWVSRTSGVACTPDICLTAHISAPYHVSNVAAEWYQPQSMLEVARNAKNPAKVSPVTGDDGGLIIRREGKQNSLMLHE